MSLADLELLTAKLPPVAFEMLARTSGYKIEKEIHVRGHGEQILNVLKVTGSVIIRDQYAIITAIKQLSNLTDMYATLYDGYNSIFLTAPTGAHMSDVPIGTFFTRDKHSSEPYTIIRPDQCRLIETKEDSKVGLPFIVTQKYGADTYVRFHYVSTDIPVDFKMKLIFEFSPLAGGKLEFV